MHMICFHFRSTWYFLQYFSKYTHTERTKIIKFNLENVENNITLLYFFIHFHAILEAYCLHDYLLNNSTRRQVIFDEKNALLFDMLCCWVRYWRAKQCRIYVSKVYGESENLFKFWKKPLLKFCLFLLYFCNRTENYLHLNLM